MSKWRNCELQLFNEVDNFELAWELLQKFSTDSELKKVFNIEEELAEKAVNLVSNFEEAEMVYSRTTKPKLEMAALMKMKEHISNFEEANTFHGEALEDSDTKHALKLMYRFANNFDEVLKVYSNAPEKSKIQKDALKLMETYADMNNLKSTLHVHKSAPKGSNLRKKALRRIEEEFITNFDDAWWIYQNSPIRSDVGKMALDCMDRFAVINDLETAIDVFQKMPSGSHLEKMALEKMGEFATMNSLEESLRIYSIVTKEESDLFNKSFNRVVELMDNFDSARKVYKSVPQGKLREIAFQKMGEYKPYLTAVLVSK